MYKKLLLSAALLGMAFVSNGQGSQVNGTAQVHPGGNLGVFNTMTFNTGYLITPRATPANNVLFADGSASSGASDASHVNGYAEKAGTTAFTFPIGDGTTYRPAGISGAASTANFQAAYFSTNPNAANLPTGAPFSTTALGTGVTAVSTTEYWDINGSVSTNVTLTWNAGSSLSALTGNNQNNLIVAGYNPSTSKWESLGNAGGITGALSGTGTVTANAVTPDSYSAFTFASSAPKIDLTPTVDIDALSFGAAGSSKDFVVNIYEVAGSPTTAQVVFAITKVSAFSITYGTTSGVSNVFGSTANNNGDWDFSETSGFVLVRLKAGKTIAANGQSVIGFTITRKAGISSNTTQNITANIAAGTGGGESPTDNNIAITSVSAL